MISLNYFDKKEFLEEIKKDLKEKIKIDHIFMPEEQKDTEGSQDSARLISIHELLKGAQERSDEIFINQNFIHEFAIMSAQSYVGIKINFYLQFLKIQKLIDENKSNELYIREIEFDFYNLGSHIYGEGVMVCKLIIRFSLRENFY